MKLKILAVWMLVLMYGLADPVISMGAESGNPSVRVLKQGDVVFASGGIGEDERQALAAMANDYNLKLIFASKASGAYLADISVSVVSTKGTKILDAVSDGPWFFAKLPAGRYKITAVAEGRSVVQQAVIGSERQTQLHFYWPAQ